MSKDISIAVNGVSTEFDGVEQLQTNKVGSGTENWLPEDETELEDLTITDNGTYTPGTGVYGFGNVTVNVTPDRVTGMIDGTEYVVTVDGDGYLVFTEVT